MSEAEIQECLDFARKSVEAYLNKKKSVNKIREYAALIQNKYEPPKTKDELLKIVLNTGNVYARNNSWANPFIIIDELKDIYDELLEYFLNPNNNKGLLVFGNVGCGKTAMMQAFSKNPTQCYAVISSNRIVNAYDGSGDDAINAYSATFYQNNKTDNYDQEHVGICIDDIGTEYEGRHYGKAVNVIEQIILNRYATPLCRGAMTHITTNLTPEDLVKKYGRRATDRMKEMFRVIEFPSTMTSLRK